MQLANGQGWNIIGSEEVRGWVERLSSIMGLKAQQLNGHPRLIFIREGGQNDNRFDPTSGLDPPLQMTLPRQDWKAFDHRILRLWSHRDVPDIICEIGETGEPELEILRMWQALLPIYERTRITGGIPLHAALVERDGLGIILAGPGDSGKSTCCQHLPPPWRSLCDDETLVVRDAQDRWQAHPFPTWSDYLWRRSERTWNVEQHLPVSAIFFLEQAEADEAVPIGPGQAAMLINQSAMEVCSKGWRGLGPETARRRRKALFDNACLLAMAVTAYILRVKANGRFWDEIGRVV